MMDCELDDLLTFMFPEILTEVVDLIFFFFLKGCAAARMIKDRDGNLLSSEVGVL